MNKNSEAKPAEQEEIVQIFDGNPFYIPYETTDLKLWQKKNQPARVQKQLIKKPIIKKPIIKTPILKHLRSKTRSEGTEWLKLSLKDIGGQLNWVQFKENKQIDYESLYDMNELIFECEEVKCNLPHAMSEMAKMMYS